MAANASAGWEPVETLGTVGPGPFGYVDTAVRDAGVDGRRFRSRSGGRAIVLVAAQLTEAGERLVATGLPPVVTHVLFVDPVDVAAVPELLAVLGERGRVVRLAVAGAAPEGVAADDGRVVVDAGQGAAVTFRLYRIGEHAPSIAPGPRIGESPDVTGARAKWFGTRHGGPNG